jgi:methionine synthase II (cobalamin-independent)
VNEITSLLAARAPKLRQAIRDAKKAGYAYVIVDGCAYRKSHPCRLGGMPVLVEDAAEAVSSADVKTGSSGRQTDRTSMQR